MADLSEPRTFETGVAFGQAVLPPAPAMWSYSSLKDVETCPLRYLLSQADYPDLWEQHGYPRLPIPAAIRGDVVHGALEIIVKALAKAGCSSTRSAEAFAVLRELGGYTKVAEDGLATQLARFDGNPRLSGDRREQLARSLTDWVPGAREQIQTYLNRMELRPSSTPASGGRAAPGEPAVRHPVRQGDYPEEELVADSLRLKGRIDLLSVDADGVAITDFMTGAGDPAHHDQLRIYALLWDADSAANPDRLAVRSLVAAYLGHEVPVAVPTADELARLSQAVATRIKAADTAIAADPPAAVLGEHCSLCSVRGLCDPYWATGVTPTVDVADGAWYDLAGTVVREHGVKSWVLREAHTGVEVLVRTPTPSFSLTPGHDAQILGARRTVDPDEEEVLIAALASVSEVLELTE